MASSTEQQDVLQMVGDIYEEIFYHLQVQPAHRMWKKHREKDEDFPSEMLRFGVVVVSICICI